MFNFNSNGGGGFIMPAVGADAQRTIINEWLTGSAPKTETVPTTPSALAAADEAAFDELVSELEKTLGATELERVFSASDRAAARADSAIRASVIKNLATFRTLRARDLARAGIDSAKTEQADNDRERIRIGGLAKGIADAEHAARGAKQKT